MSTGKDDIDGLFRSFGGNAREFQELARHNDAEEAERRWPLLQSIPPQAGEVPPALSAGQKQQWSRPEMAAPGGEALLRPRPEPLGERLASGLRQLAGRPAPGPAAATPRPPAAEPRPLAAESRSPAPEPRHPAPEPWRAPGGELPGGEPIPAPAERAAVSSGRRTPPPQAAAFRREPPAPAPRPGGLFGQARPAAPVPPAPPPPPDDNTLGSVFRRLGGREQPAAPPRGGLFGKLSRGK